ncbi:MAG: HAD-IA family hydrolase, partial [Candidatus Micrarchaeota archaeon]
KFGLKKGSDPAIFRIVMGQLGVGPQRMIFIDDREDYLVGAKAAGIRTIQFKSTEQVITDLMKLGIKVR